MNEYTDEQLIELLHEENETAKDILYDRHKNIINYMIKKYNNVALHLGLEINDLYQEALVSFTDAIYSYNPKKDAQLSTFISLCVERKIKKIVARAGKPKNQMMNDTLSLEYNYNDLNVELKELIEDEGSDPLYKITDNESAKELFKNICNILSDNETIVFELMIKGKSYTDIAKILNKESKQIDNTIQRIKNKIKKFLQERNNI